LIDLALALATDNADKSGIYRWTHILWNGMEWNITTEKVI
jgi:hypothetical protein